ncbi:MAG: arylsulfatase [Planctomycetaceae bacterium]
MMRSIAILSVFSISGLLVAATATFAADRPNIVLMMADDMGFSDLGCYGGEIETPNLDALAANGLRFTQFYNTARCCPTRASLLTGLYSHQAGIGHMTANTGNPAYQGYLNDRCRTIAEVLAPTYRTLTVGKWHVGGAEGQWPLDRGFDRYFGTPAGGGFYFREALEFRKGFVTQGNIKVEYPQNAYVTDLFTDHAIEFVAEAAGDERPFFLYFAHIAPHWPLQAKPEDIAKYAGRYDAGWDEVRAARFAKQQSIGLWPQSTTLSPRDPQAQAWDDLPDEKHADLAHRMTVYAAQIDNIDQNVGRLVSRLQELGEWDNTVFLFLSDNGCSAEGGPGGFRRGDQSQPIGTPTTYASLGLEWANVSDTPFRRFKMSTHEGGISTPLIVHWPAGLGRQGEFERQPGHVIDLLPTCADLAGIDVGTPAGDSRMLPVEGRSLLPALRGESIECDAIYWEHEGNRAIRAGDWKLVAPHNQPWELYNLAEDRTELRDLAKDDRERVIALRTRWQKWADRCGVAPWPVKKPK